MYPEIVALHSIEIYRAYTRTPKILTVTWF